MGSSRLFWKLALAHVALNLSVAPLLLGVVWPHLETGTSWGRVLATFLGLQAALGMAAGGVAWIGCSRAWRQLKPLLDAINALASEEPPRLVTVNRRSDTAALALAFQKLQRRLSQRWESLEDATARLSTVLEGMEEGVVSLDTEQRVQLANAASRRLLKISTDKIVGRPLVEVVRSREIHAAVEEALRRDATCEAELEIAGEPRRQLHVRARRLAGDPSPGVVLVIDDVSQLRRLENVRTEFAANVSHELKTPLASIKAYAETLRLGAIHDAEHNLEFVHRIEEHADRLHYLIADLMHLARVESGKEVVEIFDFPLDELVEECVDYHREAAESRQITISITPPPVPLAVRGDEVGVRTILDNLVNNAIKYTPEGGQVEVAWRRDRTQVLLEVRDNGIGIAPQDQDRVFERFFRVDKARSRDVGGTGLGLAIVKHTAQALGGSVGLETQLGSGSTFRVWLPPANEEIRN